MRGVLAGTAPSALRAAIVARWRTEPDPRDFYLDQLTR